ncbi:MAG: hypothetical protein ACLU38_11635 [Dysosmobacter sp.]
MNSEYGQSSSRENSVEQRKSMEELKRMNQPNSAPQQTAQTIQPIVIQCDLPQAMNKFTEQADRMNWELEEIRKTLPGLRAHIDLTPVQKSLTEMQKSLTEMNKLLERVGNLSERYSSADRLAPGFQPAGGPQADHTGADPWHGGTGGLVWRGGDPRPVPLMSAVAGLAAAGSLLDEDEDAEEKRRRMEAKIAAENFGAALGFASGCGSGGERKIG